MILPTAIRDAIDPLMRDIAQLCDEVARLRRVNEGLRAADEALRAENVALRGEVDELRRRLHLDSSMPAFRPRTLDWLSDSLLKGMSREALRVIF